MYMKKYIFGVALLLAVCVSPVLVKAQSGLTSSQISSIIQLLQSFGANSTTISNVNAVLGGTTTTNGPSFCYNFNNDLTVGSSGVDVSALNQALSSSGIDTTSNTSNFTENNTGNIVSFQAKYGIRQTGYVGPLTRVKLNALYGCSNNQQTTQPTITTISLPSGTVGTSYGASLSASGGSGSYIWSATGLPDGLSLITAATAMYCVSSPCSSQPTITTISGTPTTAGTYTVTVTLTSGTQTVSKQFSVVVVASIVPTIACANGATNPPNCNNGCQNKWWFDSNHSTCSSQQFCGAYMYLGLQTFDLQSACQAALPSTTSAPTIITTSLPSGMVGTSYNAPLAGLGGGTWSFFGLPAGLNLSGLVSSSACAGSSSGALTLCPTSTSIIGTPTTAGTYSVTVTLTSGTQTVSKQFSLDVAATSALSITTTSLPSGTVGTSYSASVTGAGGSSSDSYNWSVTGLPNGLQSISPTIMCADLVGPCVSRFPVTVTGTPTTAGTYTVTVTLTSGTQTVSKQFSLVVAAARDLSITTTSIPNGTVGASYSALLSGFGSNWSATGLPTGLSLNGLSSTATCTGSSPVKSISPCPTATGITGIPTIAGTYTVTVTLTSGTQTVSKQFSLIIAPGALLLGNGGTNQTASALDAFNSAVNSASETQTGFTYVWNYDLQIGSPYFADVSALQTALTKEGVYTGEITGGFYNQTFSAVKAFQQKYGIKTTGYVGSITRSKLNALY